MTTEQVDCVRRHLALVFVHEIDPSAGGPAEQSKLNDLHTPPKDTTATTKIGGVDPISGLTYRC